MGLLMELGKNDPRETIRELSDLYLGPCSIDMSSKSPNGTNWNPYGWNEAANIFFLDQPSVPVILTIFGCH